MTILSSAYFIRHASACGCSLSHVQLFATPQTVAHQASLSMGFPRQEYWVGCHFLLQGIYPSLASPALAGRFFTTEPPAKPIFYWTNQFNFVSLLVFQTKVWGLFPLKISNHHSHCQLHFVSQLPSTILVFKSVNKKKGYLNTVRYLLTLVIRNNTEGLSCKTCHSHICSKKSTWLEKKLFLISTTMFRLSFWLPMEGDDWR